VIVDINRQRAVPGPIVQEAIAEVVPAGERPVNAARGRRRYRVPTLIVSVPPLIPALKPCLQLKQAKPRDRSCDEKACHHEWSHLDLPPLTFPTCLS
jgi:hypothetical protein